jgi:hypothetical protein
MVKNNPRQNDGRGHIAPSSSNEKPDMDNERTDEIRSIVIETEGAFLLNRGYDRIHSSLK